MSSSGSSSTNPFAAPLPDPPSASAIVKINIQQHVPVVLNMDESNFQQWRTFFDLTFKKFGLLNHVDGSLDAILMQDEVEWLQIDSCITSWLYTTVAKDIMDAINRPQQSAFSAWSSILGLFLDNSLQRAVQAQQEFHSLYQGDMSITEYTGQMKRLASGPRHQRSSRPQLRLQLRHHLPQRQRSHTVLHLHALPLAPGGEPQEPHSQDGGRNCAARHRLYRFQVGRLLQA
jgi:hypothetical protein